MQSVTLPDNYDFSVESENKVISQINDRLEEIMDLATSTRSQEYSEYIADFENYTIDLFFANTLKKAILSVSDDIISIDINGINIRIDSDGTIL